MDGLYRTTRDALAPAAGSQGSARGAPRGGSGGCCSGGMCQVLFHFSVAVVYVVFHALILFVQIVCLNVAINSRNNALFTLLISNNFMELKASVFKKFEAENLFQVACSDAVERFQLLLFLLLIGVQELTSASAVKALVPSMLAIFACEVLVDYVKHAFISKFNRLHSDLYDTFRTILANDLLAVRARMGSSLDPTHSAVKRLGLATLPLAVVAHRMLLLRFWPDVAAAPPPAKGAPVVAGGDPDFTPGDAPWEVGGGGGGGGGLEPHDAAGALLEHGGLLGSPLLSPQNLHYGLLGVLVFLCLLAIKLALSMALVGSAARTILRHKNAVRSDVHPKEFMEAPGSTGSAAAEASFQQPPGSPLARPAPAPAPAFPSGTSSSTRRSAPSAGAGAAAGRGVLSEGPSQAPPAPASAGEDGESDNESVDSTASLTNDGGDRGAASGAPHGVEGGNEPAGVGFASSGSSALLQKLSSTRRYDILRGRVPL
jgi:hypothetical protein